MKYEQPIIEIMMFIENNVICSSGFGQNPDIENGDDEGEWE